MNISLLLPTRKRPHNVVRLLESIYKTKSDKSDIEVVFYIDNDDDESLSCLEDERDKYEGKLDITWISGPRIAHMGRMTNELYKVAKANIVGLIGDDVIFRTKDWDRQILAEFDKHKDGLVMVGGDDLLNYDLITHPFLSKQYVDIAGYLVPEFKGDYIDTFLYDIFNRFGLAVRLPLVIEHMHFSNSKGTLDDVMKEKLHRCYNQGLPSNLEFEYSKKERDRIATLLKTHIEAE